MAEPKSISRISLSSNTRLWRALRDVAWDEEGIVRLYVKVWYWLLTRRIFSGFRSVWVRLRSWRTILQLAGVQPKKKKKKKTHMQHWWKAAVQSFESGYWGMEQSYFPLENQRHFAQANRWQCKCALCIRNSAVDECICCGCLCHYRTRSRAHVVRS